MSAASAWRWRRARLVERRGHALAAARLISPVAVLIAKRAGAGRPKARVLEGAMRRLCRRYAPEDRAHRRPARAVSASVCGAAAASCWQHGQRQVDQLGKLLESYSFHSVLNRGFALVRDQDGHPVLAAADTRAGDTIGIEFADGEGRRQGDRGRRPPRRGPPLRRAAATAAAAIRDRLSKSRARGRQHR